MEREQRELEEKRKAEAVVLAAAVAQKQKATQDPMAAMKVCETPQNRPAGIP